MRIISCLIFFFLVQFSFTQSAQNNVRNGNTLQQSHSKVAPKNQPIERQPVDFNTPVSPSKNSVKKQKPGKKHEMILIDPNQVVKSNR